MRIGIFTDTYAPTIDGVATSIAAVQSALQEKGHEVFVFAPSQTLTYEASPREHVWRFPSVRFYGDKRHRFVVPFLFRKDFSAIPLHVVHTQDPFSLGVIGVRFARAKKLPLVHTYHTRYQEYAHYLGLPQLILAMLIKPGMRLIVSFLNIHDAIIAPSLGMRRELISFGVKKPITVIPTGIDIPKTISLAKGKDPTPLLQKFNIDTKDEVVIFASRLGKEKNIAFLIRAMAFVLRARPRARFLIVGDGNEKRNLEKMTREMGLEEKIIFAGFMNHEDLFPLYRVAKAFVFASYTETQGLAVLEAMALGLPVVALRAIGVEDLFVAGKGGFLLEKEDIGAFADAVARLLEDNKLRAVKSKEAQACARNFSIEQTTEMLIKLYQNVIASKKAQDK